MVELHKAKILHDKEGYQKFMSEKTTDFKKKMREMLEVCKFKL